MEARVKDYYKSVATAESYDSDRFSSLSGRVFDALEKRALGRAMKPAPEGNAIVLDAPCGTGRITEWLLRRGLRVTAVDISDAMLAVAARRCAPFGDRVTFRRADLEHLGLPDASFDVVTCIRLFHHLPAADMGRILLQLSRVARRLVIANISLSTPYYRVRRQVKRLLGQGVSRESTTYAQLSREVNRAGLAIAGLHFVAPYLSEDVIVVCRKPA